MLLYWYIRRIEQLLNALHLILRSHPRAVRMTDRKVALKRCSDLFGRDDSRARGTGVAVTQRIQRGRSGVEWSEEKRREKRSRPIRAPRQGDFVCDSSVSIGGGGADRYPYPVWAGLRLYPRSISLVFLARIRPQPPHR